MRKWIALLMGLFMASSAQGKGGSAHQFVFDGLTGGEIRLSDYKGKVILLVNTASECGFTKQYQQLEGLHERYAERGLVVLGVPSNDFGGQEPGDSAQIQQFCKLNYGVTFPMTTKQQVKGDGAHEFYKWAREQVSWLEAPKWNFHKYLIAKDGSLVESFSSVTRPDSEKVTEAIERELAK